MHYLRRRWKFLTIATVVLVVLWLGASLLVAYKLTRRARPRADEPVPTLTWGQAQEVRLATSDGQDLGAWFIPGKPDRPVCVLLHGNGMCRSEFIDQAEIVATAGCGAMLITLRTHGDSSGDFNDIGYSARHDVVAAVDWLEENHPGQPIIVFGQSLGSAAAVFAAGDLGERVKGYILDCPYRDLRTAVSHRMSRALPPVLDSLAYLGIVTVSPLVLEDIDRIAPVNAVRAMPPDIPVLILAGSADRMAPPTETQELKDRLGERCRMVVVEGGLHGKLHRVEPTTYRDAITAFCDGIECRRP